MAETRPTLVIFSGLPGVGKSTLARTMAKQLCWALLCIDDIIGKIPVNPDIEFWDSKVEVLLNLVNTQLEIGLNVIVDSVFMNMDRQHARELARKHRARFAPVYIFVSDDRVWQERVTYRFEALGNPDVATWERIQHQRKHFAPWLPETALFIDSLNPFETNLTRVLDFVANENIVLESLPEIPLSPGKYHR